MIVGTVYVRLGPCLRSGARGVLESRLRRWPTMVEHRFFLFKTLPSAATSRNVVGIDRLTFLSVALTMLCACVGSETAPPALSAPETVIIGPDLCTRLAAKRDSASPPKYTRLDDGSCRAEIVLPGTDVIWSDRPGGTCSGGREGLDGDCSLKASGVEVCSTVLCGRRR